MQQLIAKLNPEQRRAVTTTEGPLLVLAGAGTGKTRVITVRIAHLIEKGTAPEAILGMTFTNKAAGEMRERLAGFVGKERSERIFLGTFHAFCLSVLRANSEAAGFPAGFSICDASDQLSIHKSALRELRVAETSMQPSMLQAKISLLKNQSRSAQEFLDAAKDDEDELIGRAWLRYDDHLNRSRLLDFDDLLVRTVQLFEEVPAVLEALEQRFRYVLVDEYQDTNGPQYDLVRLMSQRHQNLCVVGDDDQAIYGWRGADVSKILGFERDFPATTTVTLETNYRSTEQVLKAANQVIKNNPQRHEKTLRSHLGPGASVMAYALDDDTHEADYVSRQIEDRVRRSEAMLSEYAVLFRTATQARPFEAQFRARAIPYVLIGGQSFFDRKEVRDLLAYLRLVDNGDDEVSFLRAIGRPARGVGKTSLDRLLAHATARGVPLGEVLDDLDEVEGLGKAAKEGLAGFQRLLATLRHVLKTTSLPDWIEKLVEAVSYRDEVERCYNDPKQCEDRWRTIGDVVEMSRNHVRRRKHPTLRTFLEALALSASDERDTDDSKTNVVTFMTLHAAKGLEFPRVYLVGLEEGLLPHSRAVAEDTIDEERRLAYVGITRAQLELTITMTKTRRKWGHTVESMPSRFFYELKGEAPPAGWKPALPPGAQPEGGRRKKKSSKRRTRSVK